MALFLVWLVHGILWLFHFLAHAGCQLSVAPQNVAAIAGPSLQLNCTTSSTNVAIQWTKYNAANQQIILSFNEDIISTPYQSNFSIVSQVSGADTSHNLRMEALQMQYGARYSCVDAAVAQNAFVHVVVLESDPVCTTNLSSNGSASVGDIIHMACRIRYQVDVHPDMRSQWAPAMRWTKPGGSSVVEQDESILGLFTQVSLYIEVSSDLNDVTFDCETFFNPPEVEPDHASNRPDYTFFWESKSFIVEGGEHVGSLSAGAIIGITIGSVAFVALIVFFAVIISTKIKSTQATSKEIRPV